MPRNPWHRQQPGRAGSGFQEVTLLSISDHGRDSVSCLLHVR